MEREINIKPERLEPVSPTFVLLLGPSGAGKNTLIREIQQYDDRIKFVSPVTDRMLREGETEKIGVTPDTFTELEENNFFLLVNRVYGSRYGTPRNTIRNILEEGNVPILDFPLKEVEKLSEYRDILYKIYVLPPSLGALRARQSIDGRNIGNTRYEESRAELLSLVHSKFNHPQIDSVLINREITAASTHLLELIHTRLSKG